MYPTDHEISAQRGEIEQDFLSSCTDDQVYAGLVHLTDLYEDGITSSLNFLAVLVQNKNSNLIRVLIDNAILKEHSADIDKKLDEWIYTFEWNAIEQQGYYQRKMEMEQG